MLALPVQVCVHLTGQWLHAGSVEVLPCRSVPPGEATWTSHTKLLGGRWGGGGGGGSPAPRGWLEPGWPEGRAAQKKGETMPERWLLPPPHVRGRVVFALFSPWFSGALTQCYSRLLHLNHSTLGKGKG